MHKNRDYFSNNNHIDKIWHRDTIKSSMLLIPEWLQAELFHWSCGDTSQPWPRPTSPRSSSPGRPWKRTCYFKLRVTPLQRELGSRVSLLPSHLVAYDPHVDHLLAHGGESSGDELLVHVGLQLQSDTNQQCLSDNHQIYGTILILFISRFCIL